MIKRGLPGRSWIGWDPLGAGLFWTWNLIFVAFMLLGFGPALLPELLRSAGQGDVPWTFVGLVLPTPGARPSRSHHRCLTARRLDDRPGPRPEPRARGPRAGARVDDA